MAVFMLESAPAESLSGAPTCPARPRAPRKPPRGAKGAVAGGFLRERPEVLQRAAHDELARRGGARQVPDRVVELEEKRARELAHVLEAAVRARVLGFGDARLAHGRDDAADEGQEDERGGGRGRLVAREEAARPVVERVAARQNGKPGDPAAQVFRELLHGRVAPLGLLARRHGDDRAEVVREGPCAAGARVGGARARQDLVERTPSGRCRSPS